MTFTHSFELLLDRSPTHDDLNELADTCPDAVFESAAVHRATFERESPSLARAIATAIVDVELPGLRVLKVAPRDLITDLDIEARAGMDNRSLTQRLVFSSAIHPKPLRNHGAAHYPYFDWSEIRGWLAAHNIETNYDATIAAANTVLATTVARDAAGLEREIESERAWAGRWRIPDWMTPHLPLVRGCDLDQIERFVFRIETEQSLAFTNIVVWAMCLGVKEQVQLLERLHAAGLLTPPTGE